MARAFKAKSAWQEGFDVGIRCTFLQQRRSEIEADQRSRRAPQEKSSRLSRHQNNRRPSSAVSASAQSKPEASQRHRPLRSTLAGGQQRLPDSHCHRPNSAASTTGQQSGRPTSAPTNSLQGSCPSHYPMSTRGNACLASRGMQPLDVHTTEVMLRPSSSAPAITYLGESQHCSRPSSAASSVKQREFATSHCQGYEQVSAAPHTTDERKRDRVDHMPSTIETSGEQSTVFTLDSKGQSPDAGELCTHSPPGFETSTLYFSEIPPLVKTLAKRSAFFLERPVPERPGTMEDGGRSKNVCWAAGTPPGRRSSGLSHITGVLAGQRAMKM